MNDYDLEEIAVQIGISLDEGEIVVKGWLRWHISKWGEHLKDPKAHQDDVKILQQDLALFQQMLEWVEA